MASRPGKPPENWAPGNYRVGDRVLWNGALLICTREHLAGDAAEHPWDPGWGWDVEKAACLWTPPDAEASKILLRHVASVCAAGKNLGEKETRLSAAALLACGVD